MAENKETVLAQTTRTNGQAVRVTESEFNGKTYFGIRLFDAVNNDYRATKSGISVESGNEADEKALAEACRALVAHVDAKYAPAPKRTVKRRPAAR